MKVLKNKTGVIYLNSAFHKGSAFFKAFIVTILILGLVFGRFLGVAAATGIEEKGYVEYQTDASVNFTEVIEVVLTDTATNYSYTHYLYRTNDYAANMSMPLGVYSISARVVSDTGDDVSGYEVVYPEEAVTVESTRLAVPIPLRVEVIMGVSASPDDYNDGGIESILEQFEDEDNVNTEIDSFESEISSEAQFAEAESSVSNVTHKNSILVSLFITGIVIIIGVAVYLFIKKRS